MGQQLNCQNMFVLFSLLRNDAVIYKKAWKVNWYILSLNFFLNPLLLTRY